MTRSSVDNEVKQLDTDRCIQHLYTANDYDNGHTVILLIRFTI